MTTQTALRKQSLSASSAVAPTPSTTTRRVPRLSDDPAAWRPGCRPRRAAVGRPAPGWVEALPRLGAHVLVVADRRIPPGGVCRIGTRRRSAAATASGSEHLHVLPVGIAEAFKRHLDRRPVLLFQRHHSVVDFHEDGFGTVIPAAVGPGTELPWCMVARPRSVPCPANRQEAAPRRRRNRNDTRISHRVGDSHIQRATVPRRYSSRMDCRGDHDPQRDDDCGEDDSHGDVPSLDDAHSSTSRVVQVNNFKARMIPVPIDKEPTIAQPKVIRYARKISGTATSFVNPVPSDLHVHQQCLVNTAALCCTCSVTVPDAVVSCGRRPGQGRLSC